MSDKIKVIVLDAMGVIYKSGDDVGELLIPFIRKHGGSSDHQLIEEMYLKASLGEISSKQFWHNVDIDYSLEDKYLQEHILVDGLEEFLAHFKAKVDVIACLSNDVSEWSYKLRKRFQLDKYIDNWYISGDLGHRKPASDIYSKMLDDLAVPPSSVVFVDDRKKNVDASIKLSIHGILFSNDNPLDNLLVCKDFKELTNYVSRII